MINASDIQNKIYYFYGTDKWSRNSVYMWQIT